MKEKEEKELEQVKDEQDNEEKNEEKEDYWMRCSACDKLGSEEVHRWVVESLDVGRDDFKQLGVI